MFNYAGVIIGKTAITNNCVGHIPGDDAADAPNESSALDGKTLQTSF